MTDKIPDIEHLESASLDIVSQKRRELLEIFPEVRTEGGKIDFDRLKLVLGETVDVGRERYGLVWPGKAECFRAIQSPSMGTLLPLPGKSVNWNATGNVIIEGDNLEVLKLLQRSYLGKIKMIYIDPPYNTGNDFIYPDNYSESLQTYLEYTGQADIEGKRFGTNTDTDGRFHSKWLSMMYPRLYLARNLLREDGVIFITIDNQEEENLKRLCNEIYGEENFVSSVTWQKKVSPANDAQWFSSDHDFVLVYARDKSAWHPTRLKRTDEQLNYYKNPDNDSRGPWNSATYTCNKSKDERPNLYYPIQNPFTGEEIWPKETAVWAYGKDATDGYVADKRLYWGVDGNARFPRMKLFLSEMRDVVPRSVWHYSEVGHTQEATVELKALLGGDVFDSPKPSRLLKRMLQIADGEGGIVLDFFAGSGTTGQAALELADTGERNYSFILVQLPERTNANPYETIADITEARVRRVAENLAANRGDLLPMDGHRAPGFRVFGLARSNVVTWDGDVEHSAQALGAQMALSVDHLRQDRSDLDILFEVLLKDGFELSEQIEVANLHGKTIYSVAAGTFLVCLERKIDYQVLQDIASLRPERVLLLDEGFAGSDELKTNALKTFSDKNIVLKTL